MSVKQFIALVFIFALVGVQAQYYGRMHNLNNVHRDPYICTCEDLLSLISLSRALEEKETTSSQPSNPAPYLSNFEELIMKLVNALVYTTTQVTQNKCHCSHSPSPDYSHGSHGNTGSSTISHKTVYSHSDTGLVDVDILNPNKKSHDSHGNTGSSTMSHKPVYSNSGSGLVDLDILNPNKKDNVLNVDVGKTQLVGIGLGGRDSATQGTATNGGQYDSSNSGGGINLDLLNTNKNNNVVDLGIGRQDVLGVGLGGGRTDSNSNSYNENTTGGSLINLSVLGANS